jgi:hypothetical protein
MKQTAVEFLVEEFKKKLIGNNLPEWVEKIIQQAKKMEKKQLEESWMDGCVNWNPEEKEKI